jgi:hypothetical protein
MVVTPAARYVRPRRWSAGLAWALWALAVLGLATLPWFDHLLRRGDRPDLVQLNASGVPFLLTTVGAATMGAVLARRRPRHPVGWLLLALGLSASLSGVTDGYARYGVVARPGALLAAGYVLRFAPLTFLASLACISFILLLTPTGSLPSPRWRWWARATAAAPVISALSWLLGPGVLGQPYPPLASPLAIHALAGPLGVALPPAITVTGLAVLVGAGSLVLRFRRARGVERQQLRWVALVAALAPVATLIIVTTPGSPLVFVWTAGVYLALLPLAIGAAILRYRLYDLDRIISRTLAYGLLTVLLGGGYAGVVLGLGQLLGQDSSLVVAGATLAVAGLFQPARRRVQQAVDRRFNRRRYDAAHTIQAFSARLREQVDLDTLTAELLAVVDQTMQPIQVSLWLRPSGNVSQDQSGAGASRAASQLAAASRSAPTAL